MARPISPFILPAADQAALEDFTRTGCRPVRAVRRAQALLALARQEGVADRLHLLGWRTDQGALLAACDVLACPSRHEPLGNVVIEAFSAGRPVVAADAAGPVELIQDGVTGLLVPREEPQRLADAVGAVLAAPALSARLAAAGRARFLAEHCAAPVLDRWRSTLATLEHA